MELPRDFILLAKSVITLEGYCVELYPEYNFVKVVEPFVKSIEGDLTEKTISKMYEQLSNLKENLIKIPEQINLLLNKINKGKLKVEMGRSEVEEVVEELELGTNRRVLGVIIAAIFLGSIIVLQIDFGYRILGIPALSFIGFLVTIILCFYLYHRTKKDRTMLIKK
jgi:ubiquinone biosynthesis protein